MSNLKTLGLAAVMVVVSIVLAQLHLMALAQTLFAWLLAAVTFGAAVIWGRIIVADARKGVTNYRRITWEASPDIFVKRKQTPAKFWRLIGYKVLSLVFILAVCVAFVLHALGLFLVA